MAREGQSGSEERHWLPPKASGKEKVDKEKAAGWKRCQREGNQSRTGTKRSWGAGASLRGVGWDRIRRQRDSATGVKEARGQPARSLARRGHSLRKGSVLLV